MKVRTASLLALAILAAALPASAAVKLPQASPAAKVSLTVGVTDVDISYHRPGVKGRAIWGALVPWDQVWRMGANEATTITFSTPVKVEGKDIPAGTYGLFAIPGKEKWTLILNQNSKQWGAYGYKKEEDVHRFDVKPTTGPATEWMAFSLWPVSESSATVEMAWETVRVSFSVSADLEKQVWVGIDADLAGKPDAESYLQAAYYAMEKNLRQAEALVWVDKSLALDDSFWGHEVKAKLLQKQGKVAEAVQHLEKAKELAQGKAPKEYIDSLDEQKADWTKK